MSSPRRLLSPILALLGIFGCQDYIFDQKCSETIKESELNRPAAEPNPADILFIVDNSGSMADEQQKLADSFDRFINEIAGTGNYRIGVVTTDQDNAIEKTGEVNTIFSTASPFFFIDINAGACMDTGIAQGCFRGPRAESRIIDSDVLDRQTQIDRFKENVLVGSCGSGKEQGLKAMISSLNLARGNGCNQGFLRPEANLVIVIVSDEEDTDSTPVAQYVNDLIAIKGAAQVRIAAIVGSVDGIGSNCSINEGSACGSLCRNMPPAGSGNACAGAGGCAAGEVCLQNRCENQELQFWSNINCAWCSYYNVADCCSALGGNRYVEFARAMEARIAQADSNVQVANCRGMPGSRVACLIDSICQANFGDSLARIAKDLVVTTEYNLAPPAIYAAGVRVKVKGTRFPGGVVELVPGDDFQVNDQGTKLTLTAGQNNPAAGEDLEIYYVSTHETAQDMPKGACGI